MSSKPSVSKKRKLVATNTEKTIAPPTKKTVAPPQEVILTSQGSTIGHESSHLTSPSISLTGNPGVVRKANGGKTSVVAMKATSTSTSAEKKNAFQELMAPKPKKAEPKKTAPARPTQTIVPSGPRLENPISRSEKGDRRSDLGTYTSNPNAIPADLRLYETEDFVAIKDLFPKSTVHTLLLFKSPKNVLHPFHFFEDAEMLAMTREEIKKLRRIVAKELERLYGKFSAQDSTRQKVLRGEITLADGEAMPKGRDWESEVMVGIHARPSMNHVHIHVLSKDRFSPQYMRHRNAYQSFNTPFFVNIDDFPLAADDPRWDSNETNSYIKADFRCWRCDRTGFKNFPDLKRHLAEEFERWKAE